LEECGSAPQLTLPSLTRIGTRQFVKTFGLLPAFALQEIKEIKRALPGDIEANGKFAYRTER
jgi:hypothetical protein